MSERTFSKAVGDMRLRAYLIEPATDPLSSLCIGYQGESERMRLTSIEEVRDLHYALGRVIAEVEECAETSKRDMDRRQ